VLFVEATSHKGGGDVILTGQLGDVMKESAQIALSYVRSHADRLGIAEDAFDGRSFHLHVPAGAIPKDGPSAGVTMATALTSLLTGRPVRHTVGMTGEVTLQGRVLPIGGLKQKVLAAHAAGLTDVILPERNRGDLDDVPEEVRQQMTFHPVMTVDEALSVALEPAPYALAFDMRVVTVDRPCTMEGRASGELAGTGRWRLFEEDGVTAVLYEWDVATTRPWMNALSPLLRPAFVWNHDWVMRQGGEGL